MLKRLQLAVCVAAGVVASGCQATEDFFSHSGRNAKQAETHDDDNSTTSTTNVDLRVLERRGIEPGSQQAKKLAAEESEALAFQRKVRKNENETHGASLPDRPNPLYPRFQR